MVESSSRGVIFGGCGVGGVNWREGSDCGDVVFDDSVGWPNGRFFINYLMGVSHRFDESILRGSYTF